MVVFWLLMLAVGFVFFIVSLILVGNSRKGAIICGIIALILGGMGIWFTRPMWHPFLFHIFYKALPFWITTIILFGGATILYLVSRNSRESVNGWLFAGPAILGFVAAFLIMIIFGGAIADIKIYESLEPETIIYLPETTEIRYLPMEIAQAYGNNKIQESEITLGDVDPIIHEGGKLDWVAAREPNGVWRNLTKQADGFAIIKSDGSVEMISQSMKYGEGMIVEDNIMWQLLFKKYLVDVPEIYYVLNDQEVVGVAPYIAYRMSFPVMVPYWGGVFLFHSNGVIEDLTPEQTQAVPYLKDQRIFPEELARIQANSWTYKYGVWNVLFDHVDQSQIPEIKYSGNQMPYLLPTAENPKWFVAAEPHGKAFGIFKIFFIDAHSGTFQVMELTKESALTGPNRVWEYVKSALPGYKWGEIIMLEPRPIVKNGVLYWMVSLTSVSAGEYYTTYGAVIETILVNAKTNEITSFKTERSLRAFLGGRGESSTLEQPTLVVDKIVEEMVDQANDYFAEYQRLTGEGRFLEAAQALQELRRVLLTIAESIKR